MARLTVAEFEAAKAVLRSLGWVQGPSRVGDDGSDWYVPNTAQRFRLDADTIGMVLPEENEK